MRCVDITPLFIYDSICYRQKLKLIRIAEELFFGRSKLKRYFYDARRCGFKLAFSKQAFSDCCMISVNGGGNGLAEVDLSRRAWLVGFA